MITETRETVDETFAVEAGATLSVRDVAGRITVRPGPAGEIRMHAVKHGRNEAVTGTRIETEGRSDRVEIAVVHAEHGLLGKRHGLCAVDFDLQVPPGTAVEAHAVSAEVDIRDLGSPVTVEAVSGGVTVHGARGECAIKTVSGGVHLERVDGSLQVETVSGGTRVSDSRLQRLEGKTVSGGVTVGTALQPGGEYTFHAVSGTLRLEVPEGTGATLRLKTVSGSMHADLPLALTSSGRRNWEGTIGDGGARVEMESVSGSLHIARAPGRTSQPEPLAQTAESPEVDTMAVLAALERGEIDVTEAGARLAARR